MDQRELVGRAKRGDHDAFAELVDPALARLDAAARLILRDPELARDAVQEALIRAWRDLPGLRDPDRFDAWLRRLTVNACLDLARRRRRRPIEVELTPIDSPAPSDMSGALADRELVDAALRRLDPGHRAVVAMYYLLGMPLHEVAASLGIPIGTAKSRLHYALAAMRVGGDGRARPGPGAGPRRAGRMTTERSLRASAARHPRGPVPGAVSRLSRRRPGRRDRTRQRPAWTFPGRWLPMADYRQPARVRATVPWRPIGVRSSSSLCSSRRPSLYVGSRPAKLPPPFGPAGTEGSPIARGGDIYIGDPADRDEPRRSSTGPEMDGNPLFARDGTRVAFMRRGRRSGDPRRSTSSSQRPTGAGRRSIAPDLDTDHPLRVVAGRLVTGRSPIRTVPASIGIDATGADAADDCSSNTLTATHAEFRPPDGRRDPRTSRPDRSGPPARRRGTSCGCMTATAPASSRCSDDRRSRPSTAWTTSAASVLARRDA